MKKFCYRKGGRGEGNKACGLQSRVLGRLLSVAPEDLPYVHNSGVRDKIQNHFPKFRVEEGRDIVLRHMSLSTLTNFHDKDQDEDALGFQWFIKRLRRTTFDNPTTFQVDL